MKKHMPSAKKNKYFSYKHMDPTCENGVCDFTADLIDDAVTLDADIEEATEELARLDRRFRTLKERAEQLNKLIQASVRKKP
jgi:hypothetical protein